MHLAPRLQPDLKRITARTTKSDTEQFRAWSGSGVFAIVGQAVFFGLSHGYYNKIIMIGIMLVGLTLGLMAQWRRSLRPGMLGHGFIDSLGGVIAFFWGP